jgi:outer membrane receptor protein involved in Fe transport
MAMSDTTRETSGRSSPALAAAISATLSGVAGTASAQTSGGLETIIVTATRRAENLQDVSESISAFDSAAIEIRGLKQMDDYAKYIPGLSLGVREPGATTIVFRGVANSGLSYGSVSSSALYLDEQPITQSGRNPDPRLIDIERLEALRGPQGTLYGASSQSGTLRIITNKPDPSEFDAWVDGQVSTIQDGGTGYDVSAMVNIPLVEDRLALRLVGFTAEDAGFIDNVLSESPGGSITGEPFTNENVADDDVNSAETSGGRAALRWDVTDDVDITLGAVFQDVSADGHGDVNLDAGDLNQVRFEKEGLDDKWYQLALTLNASTGFGDLILSASYFDRDFHYDADATAYEFTLNQNYITCVTYYGAENCYHAYDFGGDPRGFATNDEQTEITTFEARLQSPADSDSRWAWLVGAFYSEERGHADFDSFIRGYADTGSFYYFAGLQPYYGADLQPTDRWFLGVYDTELDQVAVFGELSYDLTENFTITAGARWFDYDRKFKQHQEQPEGFGGFSLLDGDQASSEDGDVVKLNATYHFDDDRLVYATYSEGFRVGGSNPIKPASVLPGDYASDKLKNYEIGLKSEWLDNTLRFNVAAYYMKWENFAVQIEDPQALFQLGFVNLPSAEIPGAEADFAFSVNENWQLDGALSWNDAQVDGAASLDFGEDEQGNPLGFTVQDGARLPITPDWQATLGIEYRASGQLFDAQPYARFDFAYVGESVNSLEGIESVINLTPVDTQDAYETGDLRLGLDGDRWSASLFVDNVWDERAEIFFSNRWGVQRLAINRPRTYGLQLRFNF